MTEFQIKLASIAYRFNTPYPFDEDRFLALLLKGRKFVKKQDQISVSRTPVGTMENYYSVSEKTLLNFQPHEGIFGLRSENYTECRDLFEYMQKIIFKDMKIAKDEISFLEYIANGLYTPKKEPLNVLNSKIKTSNIKFGDDSLEIFGARFYNSSDKLDKSVRKIQYWTDVRIEPLLLNPKLLFWEVTYRNTDIKTMKSWKYLEQNVLHFVKNDR